MATKKRGRAASKKVTKDKTTARAAGSPLPMTQQEVEAMVAGASLKDVDRRLRAHSPSKGPAKGTRKSDKLAPVPFSAAEMAKLKKTGTLSESMRERIEKSAERDVISTRRVKKRKDEPTEPSSYKSG